MARTKRIAAPGRNPAQRAVPVAPTPEQIANKAVADTLQYKYYVDEMNGQVISDFKTFESLKRILEALISPLDEPSSAPQSSDPDGPTIDMSYTEIVESHVRDSLGEVYMAAALTLVLADANLSVQDKTSAINRFRRAVITGTPDFWGHPLTFTCHYDGLAAKVLRILSHKDEAFHAALEAGGPAPTLENAWPGVCLWLTTLQATLPSLLDREGDTALTQADEQNYDFQCILAFERYLCAAGPVVLRPVPVFGYDRGVFGSEVTEFLFVRQLLMRMQAGGPAAGGGEAADSAAASTVDERAAASASAAAGCS